MNNRAVNQIQTPANGDSSFGANGGEARGAYVSRRLVCHAGLLSVLLLAVSGCPPQQPKDMTQPDSRPLAPLPVAEAVSLINNQVNLIDGGLQATGGFAKGYFTDVDGKRRSFNQDAALLVLPPRYLRFDMKVLGNSVMLFGSNATRYWLATKMDDEDALWWGRHSRAGSFNIRGVTLQPVTMIEALGVGALPTDPLPVQRVTLDHQQLIVMGTSADGKPYVEKEYWLSRRAGRNLVRILMRTPDGQVAMDAHLSNHEMIQQRGPSIPRRIEIDWPVAQGRLIFTCRSWKIQPRVDRAFAGFAFPLDRGEKFERIIDIDREYGTPIRARRPDAPLAHRPVARRAEGPPSWPTNETAPDGQPRPDYDSVRETDSDAVPRPANDEPSSPTTLPRPSPQPKPEQHPKDTPDKSDRPEEPKDPNVWWDPDRSQR